MLKQHRIIVSFLAVLFLIFISVSAQAVTYPYLEDADTTPPPTNPNAPSIDNHLWPRTMLGDSYIDLGARENRYSKYNVISTQPAVMKAVGRIQSQYPDMMYFRMFTPRETQEYLYPSYCSQNGIPFEGTAAATAGCNVYAGHWLYRAGATTTASISASSTTIGVSDTSKFIVGRYVVIYNAPAGSFTNAEHAKVTAINNSTGKITVQRGFKSTAVSHPKGAIVALHVLGQAGNHPENWAFNLSSQSPKDANNRTAGMYMAFFLKNNLTKSWQGENIAINVSGIMFDVDYHFELRSKLADVNNDLITDHGISPAGVNWYGDGMNAFYSKVRSYFPDLYIVGGTPRARGGGILSGIQFEGWLTGFEGAAVDYGNIDSRIANYTYFSHNQSAPIHSNGLMKQGTKIYPTDGKYNSNSLFRLSLGTILLEDGYFGQQTTKQIPDTWYDEFSVDVEANSPTYGQAVVSNPYDESATRKSRGWLGKPQGPRKRIYGTQFDVSKTLIPNGSFDTDINGWSGSNVTISRVTANKMDGAGAVKISKHTPYQDKVWNAMMKGPQVSLTKNKEYTLTFSAKSAVLREITAKVGGSNQSFLIGPKWRRYVMTFKEGAGGLQKVQFQVGMENSIVYLDTVHLFAGNANVFRRDFTNGIVIVNATNAAKTVSLGNTFQKIMGNQDPTINDGSTVTSVTVPKMDAILLVRPDNSAPPANAECGAPTYNAGSTQAIYLWKDCAGDGSWRFRITGGGSASTVNYDGSVSLLQTYTNSLYPQGFVNVTGFSIEASDLLDVSDLNNIVYKLKAAGSGQDGVDFRLPLNASACFNSTSHASLRLGSGAISMPLPLNIETLGTCALPASGNTVSGVIPDTPDAMPGGGFGASNGVKSRRGARTNGRTSGNSKKGVFLWRKAGYREDRKHVAPVRW